jgi:hypothetical protein
MKTARVLPHLLIGADLAKHVRSSASFSGRKSWFVLDWRNMITLKTSVGVGLLMKIASLCKQHCS